MASPAETKDVGGKTQEPQSDQDPARRLKEEAESFTALLKSQGYAVHIARGAGDAVKPASGSAFCVLLVNAAPMESRTVCEFLELEGYVLRRASNRNEVVAELRKAPSPDLILLDVMLTDISGYEILRRVRSHQALKHIPIIMVTGNATHEEVMRALAAGANGCITKPFEFDSLTRSIKTVLGLDFEPPPGT